MLTFVLGLFFASASADTITLRAGGVSYEKRYVLRVPEPWNGKLVIGVHGGSGGEAYSRDGKVIGTDETALDDVIGHYAEKNGYAYASIDRDGIGGTAEGLALTYAFVGAMKQRLDDVTQTYFVGLSMGGGITRLATEDPSAPLDGAVIIAGAHGDAATRAKRQSRMSALWPLEDDEVADYAEAVQTPVAARRFWPFIGHSSTRRAPSTNEGSPDTSGAIRAPVIEVVGTFDDFVRAEVLAYKRKTLARGTAGTHRLYQVEGAWHISPDDDAITSFQFIGSRMGLASEELDAMATGTSYIPIVHEALDLLDLWVSSGTAPPADRTFAEGERLSASPLSSR